MIENFLFFNKSESVNLENQLNFEKIKIDKEIHSKFMYYSDFDALYNNVVSENNEDVEAIKSDVQSMRLNQYSNLLTTQMSFPTTEIEISRGPTSGPINITDNYFIFYATLVFIATYIVLSLKHQNTKK
jgi:hypothetical protein